MGRLKNKILGDVTGKVGNVVFRTKHKESYMYAVPQKVKISQTPQAKRARNKFIPLSNFASFINSIPELKYFWTISVIKASSTYHKISKGNYRAFLFNRPTVDNMITTGFKGHWGDDPVTISNIDKSGVRIEAFLDMDKSILLAEETEITSIAVVCFYNPIEREGNYFDLHKIIRDKVEIQIDELFELRLSFTGEMLNSYYSYRNSILYFTLITKDKNGKPIRFTTNHTCEFVHEFSMDEKKVSDRIQRSKKSKRIKDELKGYFTRIFSRGEKRKTSEVKEGRETPEVKEEKEKPPRLKKTPEVSGI
jgi:hypothetical protein